MSFSKTVFQDRCPKCEKGRIFKRFHLLKPKTWYAMHEHCPTCSVKFEKEVGFFYGSMYVSYGITSGIFIIAFLIDALWIEAEIWQFLTLVISLILLLSPLTYRVARRIWLALFFKSKK